MVKEPNKDDEIEIEFGGRADDKNDGDIGLEEDAEAAPDVAAGSDGDESGSDEHATSVEQKFSEYEEKLKDWEDRYLRLAAEFENYKKRTYRQFQELTANVREETIAGLLDIVDDFERALEASADSTDFKALRTGTKMIYQNLLDFLKKNGVEPIEAISREFDPNVHEAVMQVPSEEYPEGVVVSELARGYKLNNKVIRFSKVAVSRGKSDADDESSE